MLDMRAFGVEHVLGFVLDLPASTACLGDLRDVFAMPTLMGDKAVVREVRPCFGIDRGHREPRHAPGPFATLQQDLVKRAIPRDAGADNPHPASARLPPFIDRDGLLIVAAHNAPVPVGLAAHHDDVDVLATEHRDQLLRQGLEL